MAAEASETPEQREALDILFSATYEELRRLASRVKGNDPSTTLNPTALVNEAWLKLSKSPRFVSESPLHFKRIAARAMRQLLVEAARRRGTRKRDFDPTLAIPFLEVPVEPNASAVLLDLDSALDNLSRLNPRQATVVELRFFGGMEVTETADALGVSEATIMRDWRAARAWLGHELRRGEV